MNNLLQQAGVAMVAMAGCATAGTTGPCKTSFEKMPTGALTKQAEE